MNMYCTVDDQRLSQLSSFPSFSMRCLSCTLFMQQTYILHINVLTIKPQSKVFLQLFELTKYDKRTFYLKKCSARAVYTIILRPFDCAKKLCEGKTIDLHAFGHLLYNELCICAASLKLKKNETILYSLLLIDGTVRYMNGF